MTGWRKRQDYVTERAELDPESGCWLWTLALKGDGYGVATVNGKYVRAHRLSWQAFRGEIPEGRNVLHKCDVRHCVNPEHLFLGDNADNSADMVQKGRSAKGSGHSQARLTEGQVAEILASDKSNRQLAAEYGVVHGTIDHIKAGKTWKHVAILKSGVLE